MIDYRILILSLDGEGNLIVPGAFETDFQRKELWTCKGKKIVRPGTNGRGTTYENYAIVQHITGDIYVVFAKDFSKIDEENKGKDIKTYGAWLWKVIERTYDNDGNITSEVETDTPTIPTEIAGSGMVAKIQSEPLTIAAIV